MTLKNVIDAYKLKNPSNPKKDQQLTDFITSLENMIQIEILNTYPKAYTTDRDGKVIESDGKLISYNWETDQDTSLLLSDTAFDDVYLIYVTAMVQFDQNDFMKYSNSRAMFTARYMEATYYFGRTEKRPVRSRLKNLW